MMNIHNTQIDMGYNDFYESARISSGLSSYPVARVSAEHKEAYTVICLDGNEYLAKITGKQMYVAQKREDYPAVGDWVAIEILPDKKAIIRGTLPRKTLLKKKYSNKQENQIIAANIDCAFIVQAMDRDYSLNRFERYLVLASEAQIYPFIVLNKIDLISENELQEKINQVKNRFKNIEVISATTMNKQGINELNACIKKGMTYCFLGSSGVGKSSLINALLGREEIKTHEINSKLERGTHTTTTREMFFLKNGGIVVDNPGIREVGIGDSESGIVNIFDEIGHLSVHCKFSDCSHTSEPGCAVLKAVNEGILDGDRYTNYIKLKKESEFYQMTDLEKREKDRKFGKFVKKALKELKSS
jgi:ribosome biogenesis GTPase / thiamine phosphate phosphatase